MNREALGAVAEIMGSLAVARIERVVRPYGWRFRIFRAIENHNYKSIRQVVRLRSWRHLSAQNSLSGCLEKDGLNESN